MLVRRILLVLIVLGFAGLGAWLYYFYEPAPDVRLTCTYGAYDLSDGRVVVLSPSSGAQSLRFVFMDGDTGRLLPVAGQSGVPRKFAAGPGWAGETPVRATAEFGTCDEGKVTLALDGKPPLTGTRQTFDFTEATFDSHGKKLFGRLVMPRLEGAIPVAVLVHGSEADSAVVFNRLQYLLPANGIGVFVYDKRGTGKSQGKYTQDFDLLADDAAAALTKARELAGTLASEVGFQGGSQAGWIEPLAAMKVKADFVLVGFGLAESPLAEDRDEVFDDLRTAGYGEDVIAKARAITHATGRVVATHFADGYDELDAMRAKYGNEPWYKKANGEYTGTLLAYPDWLIRLVGPMFDVGTPMEYDPLPPLQAYEGPHLWILAGRDSSAPSENTLRVLRQVQTTRANLDVVVFPNADHGIVEFEEKDGERIDTHFSDGYFQLMVDWLLFKETKVRVQGPIVYEGGAAPTASP
jgi:pimeloyl-ACP methyl ester carboxylesterase